MEDILIETLVEGVGRGLCADSGYKEIWVAAERELKSQLNMDISVDKLKSKHDGIKAKYKIWYHLVSQFGFGRDPVTGGVTASDEVWDRYPRIWKGIPRRENFEPSIDLLIMRVC